CAAYRSGFDRQRRRGQVGRRTRRRDRVRGCLGPARARGDAADPRLEEPLAVVARDGAEEGVAGRRPAGRDRTPEQPLEGDVDAARARERVDAPDDTAALRAIEQELRLTARRYRDPRPGHVDAGGDTRTLDGGRARARGEQRCGGNGEDERPPHTSLRNQTPERSAPTAMNPTAPIVHHCVISRFLLSCARREPRSLYTCCNAAAEPALKNRPPVDCASAWSCAGAAGTACCSVYFEPGSFWYTIPSGVPSAMVEIGTSSLRACAIASAGFSLP